MRLGSFEIEGTRRLGVFEDDRVIDLNAAYRSLLKERGVTDPDKEADTVIPSDLSLFIGREEISMPAARETLDYIRNRDYQIEGCVHPLSQIAFKPSHRPPKIVCTGSNYEDYRRLIGIDFSPVPLIFLKSPTAVIGHNETICIPIGYGVIYHEWELSCVISKRCKCVPRDKINEVIFGYTILNDITARSLEASSREYQPWGKNMDTFAPMGPWVVTREDMPQDLYNLRTLRRRNGNVECESNTSNMRLGFGEIIEFVSNFWTLDPGDVITTATPPAGPIEPGDLIEAEIEGIGVLRNPVEGVEVDLKYAQQINLKEII